MLNVVDNDFANGLPPRWEGQRWVYPSSHLLKSVLMGFFADNGIEYAAYRDLCHDVEYRTGLVQFLLPSQEDRYRHNPPTLGSLSTKTPGRPSATTGTTKLRAPRSDFATTLPATEAQHGRNCSASETSIRPWWTTATSCCNTPAGRQRVSKTDTYVTMASATLRR